MFGSVMVPGDMGIEEVHGLQSTKISLNDRFAMCTAEYLGRIARLRKRTVPLQSPRIKWFVPNQMSQRVKQQFAQCQPIKQRLGMPALRRFGSDGNLPALRRSNSANQLNQTYKRTRWTSFNGSRSVSRASSVDNMSNASWHGRTGYVRRRGNFGQLRGRMRGGRQGRQQLGQKKRLRNRAGGRGRGRGRGGLYRNQQNRKQDNNQNENQPNNQQTKRLNVNNQNKPVKLMLTKEELDAQLDQYMALSQKALDRELDEYMMKGALMEVE